MSSERQPTGALPQSRIGKRPVPIPRGVQVGLQDRLLSVSGPRGTLRREIPAGVQIEVREGRAQVTPTTREPRDGKRLQGLVRALLAGMVKGVSEGYSVALELYGLGYRAELKGRELNLALGYSHPVIFPLPDTVEARVETVEISGIKRPRIHISSHDKELLGLTVARIRSFRRVSPYQGKGIRFMGEKVREKAGKSVAKT
jgi:large subunit ribosomal protein L6